MSADINFVCGAKFNFIHIFAVSLEESFNIFTFISIYYWTSAPGITYPLHITKIIILLLKLLRVSTMHISDFYLVFI